MTLLFVESFDHYAAFVAGLKGWFAVTGGNGFGAIAAVGRNGTNGTSLGNRTGQGQNLPGNPATVITGAAWNFAAVQGEPFLDLRDGATTQVDLRVLSQGQLQATRNGAVLGTTGLNVILPGAYNYIEMRATIDPVAGVVVVRVNGATVLNLVGQNTRATAASQVNAVYLGHAGMVGGASVDDFYICDSAGAINNTFLGDVRIQAIVPSGAGNYTEWDGLTGAATHWQAQASNPPDGDASYVSDTLAAPGHRDTYAMGNLTPGSGTVPAVQVSAYTRKDDAGARTLATMVRGGAGPVDATGAPVALTNAFGFVTQIYELDPAGAAWTIASVNAAEAGVKAVA